MQKELFRSWLLNRRTVKAASDCISRCKKVENTLGIDLDQEYQRDKGCSVLQSLQYGQREVNKGIPMPEDFGFKQSSNPVQRYTDLRCSVKQYFLFCDQDNS